MTKTVIDTGTIRRLRLVTDILDAAMAAPDGPAAVIGVIVTDPTGTYRYDAAPNGYSEELLEPPPPAPDAAEPPLADAGANG